ncbi:MAG: hypothetical protein LAN37_07745 [Acidobacteriia bacterium]|nr:hypothetical protein [Terriglobia bacterium]
MIELSEILRLKAEVAEDLRALERVERLLRRKSGNVSSTSASAEVSPHNIAQRLPTRTGKKPERGQLKRQVISAIREAGPAGMRPKDVVAYVRGKGYTFRDDVVAASVVSTAIRRLFRDGALEQKEGKYHWK